MHLWASTLAMCSFSVESTIRSVLLCCCRPLTSFSTRTDPPVAVVVRLNLQASDGKDNQVAGQTFELLASLFFDNVEESFLSS
jgi:hypothetical protein